MNNLLLIATICAVIATVIVLKVFLSNQNESNREFNREIHYLKDNVEKLELRKLTSYLVECRECGCALIEDDKFYHKTEEEVVVTEHSSQHEPEDTDKCIDLNIKFYWRVSFFEWKEKHIINKKKYLCHRCRKLKKYRED